MADQQIPRPSRLFSTRMQRRKGFFFPCRRKRPRKGTAFQMQQKIQYMPDCRLQEQAQNLKHNTTPCHYLMKECFSECVQKSFAGCIRRQILPLR